MVGGARCQFERVGEQRDRLANGRTGRARRARGELTGEGGQSTVEYLLVLVGFLALLVALGALWHVGSGGGLVRISVDAASHGYGQGTVPLLKDVLGY